MFCTFDCVWLSFMCLSSVCYPAYVYVECVVRCLCVCLWSVLLLVVVMVFMCLSIACYAVCVRVYCVVRCLCVWLCSVCLI